MNRPESHLIAQRATALVAREFTKLGWAFHDQPMLDSDIDAQVEVIADGAATGRLLGLHIKAGRANFSQSADDGWVYRGRDRDGDGKNLRYWLGHTLPVLIVLCDLDANLAYWQHVTEDRIKYTSKGWTIVIPRSQTISLDAIGRLIVSAAASQTKKARMTLAGREDARTAIRHDGPAALLGARENSWLDVKSGIYRLDLPSGPEELAKDVAAFANTPTGGLLLVGFSTRKVYDEEVLDALKPIPRKLVDLDRHRKIIASRVMPALRDVGVDWFDCGQETGVLVIDIPAQPRSSQLFVVPAPTGTEQVNQRAAGVPIRQGDGTVWLPAHEIQRLVGLGWASSGDAAARLAAAVPPLAMPISDRSKYEVGGGIPEWRGIFNQAFNDLAQQGLWLGEPATEVYAVGPGVVQHFETPTELFGWVLCARPNQRPVAVAGDVWQALQDAGSGAPDGDALSALGFPIGDPKRTRVVDKDAQTVELSGGRWGRGWLNRVTDEQAWWWGPSPISDTAMSAASRNWTATSTPPQMRARVLATLPWADTEDLAITAEQIAAFVRDAPSGPLAGIMAALSLRRGKDLRASAWGLGQHQNANDRLSYSSKIFSPEGQLAQSAEVMMALPQAAMSSTMVTCAEVRVEDFVAWARALGLGVDDVSLVDLRWSISDVFEFFVAAWETAIDVLPALAMNDPTRRRRWSGIPRIELWISADQRHHGSRSQLLQDVVDLTAFGDSDRCDQMTEMMIAVPAVPGLTAEVRQSAARKAMVEMAHRFGFMGATETSF